METKSLEQKLRGLYKSSDSMKSALESTFGKDITERINTWEDMLAETGLPDTPEFTELPERLRDHFRKYYRCVVMTEAYNEGEKMDIYNSSKWRYFPRFLTQGSPAAFAFRGSNCVNSLAFAGSGSRLALKSEKLSKIVGTKHIDFYREYLES
ncbi:hypothetical protein D0T84_01080 [Dysgonomonas sp. 521]|uniref:hypothetical protein n=1 Tax=Dysgonomonas sp. 521 TaxID=2302932 RepID=UPI0013D29872|nr:hypothetical protein [Dysgonomonas sp. 521]NDV93509.1 hypothetical protein [Dysgonomonas sp. 521]